MLSTAAVTVPLNSVPAITGSQIELGVVVRLSAGSILASATFTTAVLLQPFERLVTNTV